MSIHIGAGADGAGAQSPAGEQSGEARSGRPPLRVVRAPGPVLRPGASPEEPSTGDAHPADGRPDSPAADRGSCRQEKVELDGFTDGRVGRVSLVRRGRRVALRWRQDGRQRWETVRAAHGEDVMQVAVARAGEVNRALSERSSPGTRFARTTVGEACDLYLLAKEAQADVSGRSIRKYASSLARVKEFAERAPDGRRRRHLHSIDTRWCEDLARWLDGIRCTRNGGPATPRNPERPLSSKQKREIKRCFRSVIEFARFRTPPLVPPASTNPITRHIVGRAPNDGHALSGPPVTMDELVAIVAGLDPYGLGLLGTLFLYGPRPSELGRILRSDLDDAAGFLHMISRPETGYCTKGRRDKIWPVTRAFAAVLGPFLVRGPGPLFVKRRPFLGKAVPPLAHADGPRIASEFEARLREETSRLGRVPMKARVERVSQAVWTAAGAVSAKDVARELARAARRAGLSREPTPKDVRHLFATQCAEARLAPGVIRQLLGHAPLRDDMLVHYVHTARDVLREQVNVLDQRRKPLIDALAARAQELAGGRDVRGA